MPLVPFLINYLGRKQKRHKWESESRDQLDYESDPEIIMECAVKGCPNNGNEIRECKGYKRYYVVSLCESCYNANKTYRDTDFKKGMY